MLSSGGGKLDLESLRNTLQQQASDLSPSSKKVLDWILRNTLRIAWTGVENVAQQAGVSTATVVKTLKQCGFEGYSDLQRKIRDQMPDSFLVARTFQGDSGESSMISSVIHDEKANLDQLEGSIAHTLPRLLQLLLDARKVYIAASNMTTPLAEYFALHLELLLGNVSFVDAGNVQSWLVLRNLTEDDCVIGLSFPRYSQFTGSFLLQAAEQTRKIVLMTDYVGPSLSEADLTVHLPAHSHYYQSSHVSLTALLQILARYLAQESPERIASNLEAADGIRSRFHSSISRHSW
jgi:DNA-binding MurR/RpiR family transcriptional regulator